MEAHDRNSAPFSMTLARGTRGEDGGALKVGTNDQIAPCCSGRSVRCCHGGMLNLFCPPAPLVTVAPQLPEKMPELRTGIPINIDRPKAQEKADDFLQAAQAILKHEPNAQASVDRPTVTGHIPLPKKRPIPR